MSLGTKFKVKEMSYYVVFNVSADICDEIPHQKIDALIIFFYFYKTNVFGNVDSNYNFNRNKEHSGSVLGRVLDSRSRGSWLESHQRLCVKSFSKTL